MFFLPTLLHVHNTLNPQQKWIPQPQTMTRSLTHIFKEKCTLKNADHKELKKKGPTKSACRMQGKMTRENNAKSQKDKGKPITGIAL